MRVGKWDSAFCVCSCACSVIELPVQEHELPAESGGARCQAHTGGAQAGLWPGQEDGHWGRPGRGQHPDYIIIVIINIDVIKTSTSRMTPRGSSGRPPSSAGVQVKMKPGG